MSSGIYKSLSVDVRNAFKDLQGILLAPPYQIITSLCYIMDENPIDEEKFSAEELASILVNFLTTNNATNSCLSILLSQEVEKTADETTLFRRNCMTTKIVAVQSKKLGLPYLQKVLQPNLIKLLNIKVDNYEVDTRRLSTLGEDKLVQNVQNLIELTDKIFTSIIESEPLCPPGLKQLFKNIFNNVKSKFPNSQYSSIGGFVFLRFFCPAFITPEKYGILPEGSISGPLRRVLILVSKIIQNISNNAKATSKEEYMQKMNDYVETSVPKAYKFFESLVTDSNSESISLFAKEVTKPDVENFIFETETSRLIDFLKVNINKLGVVIISGKSGKTGIRPACLQKSQKTGFLYKHSENVFTSAGMKDGWQKRWFLLRNKQILYFKSIQDSHAVGIISLNDYKINIVNQEEAIFEIDVSFRAFLLKAPNVDEMNDWIKNIEEAKEEKSKQVVLTTNTIRKHKETVGASRKPSTLRFSAGLNRSGSLTNVPIRRNEKKESNESKLTSEKSSSEPKSSWTAIAPKQNPSNTSSQRFFMSRSVTPNSVEMKEEKLENNQNNSTDNNNNNNTNNDNINNIVIEVKEITQISDENSPSEEKVIEIEEEKKEEESSERVEIKEEKTEESIEGKPTKSTGAIRLLSKRKSRIEIGNHLLNKELNALASTEKCQFSGTLLLRNNQMHSWDSRYFEIVNNTLYGYHSSDKMKEAIVEKPLQKAMVNILHITTPNCFEILFEDAKFVLQAEDEKKKLGWVNEVRNSIALSNKSSEPIKEGKLLLLSKGMDVSNWKEVWVVLTEVYLSIYQEQANISPICKFEIANSILRKIDNSFSFEITDDTKVIQTLRSIDEQSLKIWMNDIKKAKVNYWNLSNGKVRASLLIQDNNSKDSLPINPSLSVPTENSLTTTESGYLYKYDKDKKTSTRIWLLLRNQTLFFYRNEKATQAMSTEPIGKDTSVRIHDEEFTTTFEVAKLDSTITLEASSIEDMRRWVRAINSAKSKKNSIFDEENFQTKKGKLTITNFGDAPETSFWFVLSSTKLRIYVDQSESQLVGSIPIEYSVVRSSEDDSNFEIFNTIDKTSYIIRVEDKNEIKDWLKQLKLAKLRYWQSAKDDKKDVLVDEFSNRGYLMKCSPHRNRWDRRWFVIKDEFLLYFKTPKEPTPLGEILLSNCFIRKADSEESSLRFDIRCPHRTYHLESNNSTELSIWIKALKQAKLGYWNTHPKSSSQSIDSDANQDESHNLNSIENIMSLLVNPEWEGFLMKQGVTRKAWKRRWFVLKYPTFYYFTSSQISPGEQVGEISLKDATLVQDSNLQFQILTRSRNYFLRSDNEDNKNQCINSIQSAKQSFLSGDQSSANQSQKPAIKKIDKVGYLIKKGRTNKVWKKRWFTLQFNLLSYYKTNQDLQPCGVISLTETTISEADESIKRKFCFVLSTKYRNYFLQAADQYEMASWMESLKFHSSPESQDKEVSVGVKIFNKLNQILAICDKEFNNNN